MIQIHMVNLNVLLNAYKTSDKNQQILLLNLEAPSKSFFAGLSPVNAPPRTLGPVSSCGEN